MEYALLSLREFHKASRIFFAFPEERQKAPVYCFELDRVLRQSIMAFTAKLSQFNVAFYAFRPGRRKEEL